MHVRSCGPPTSFSSICHSRDMYGGRNVPALFCCVDRSQDNIQVHICLTLASAESWILLLVSGFEHSDLQDNHAFREMKKNRLGSLLSLLFQVSVELAPVRQRLLPSAPPGPHEESQKPSKILGLRERGASRLRLARRDGESVLPDKDPVETAFPFQSVGRVGLDSLK